MPPSSALAPFVGGQKLGINVSRGVVYANSSIYVVNDTFVPCVASAMNFVYLTLSPTTAIAVNQSGFPGTNALPIAIVITTQGGVEYCTDFRPDWALTAGGSGGGGGSGPNTVASLTLANLSGNNAGTLLANPVAGMYQAYLDVLVNSPSGSGSLVVTVTWNNGVSVASMSSAQIDLTQTGETSGLIGNFFSTAGQPISYSAVATGDDGTERYQLAIRLVYLG